MKSIHRSQIVAVDKDDNVVLRSPPNAGYDPMPYATALRSIEADIKALTRIELAEEAAASEVRSELTKMLQIGRSK